MRKAEGGRRRSEIGSQGSEGGGRNAESGTWTAEGGGRRAEAESGGGRTADGGKHSTARPFSINDVEVEGWGAP